MSRTTKDKAEVFAATSSYISDIHGNRVEVPRMTARLTLKTLAVITRHVDAMSSLEWPEEVNLKEFGGKDLAKVLPVVIGEAPDFVADICGTILERDPETILDDFDLEALIEVLYPFLSGQVSLIQKVSKVFRGSAISASMN